MMNDAQEDKIAKAIAKAVETAKAKGYSGGKITITQDIINGVEADPKIEIEPISPIQQDSIRTEVADSSTLGRIAGKVKGLLGDKEEVIARGSSIKDTLKQKAEQKAEDLIHKTMVEYISELEPTVSREAIARIAVHFGPDRVNATTKEIAKRATKGLLDSIQHMIDED